jgi:hypothetical protein
MSAKRDTWKTICACLGLTIGVLTVLGVWGGFTYAQERNELLSRIEKLEIQVAPPDLLSVSVDPLTQSEIELIESLKESIELKELVPE